ncbi:hypothetical protein LUZ61_008891 [Rhynchospora tenuis]|uniref:BHLH domain-containing protein n=1 Tax=Rhynchospora tenuis TaxID=198213 RepID=A0AAD5ZW66_9POAL|nr:hypothetical protein LUZ61_008891 [Rhynchospora tenuis]
MIKELLTLQDTIDYIEELQKQVSDLQSELTSRYLLKKTWRRRDRSTNSIREKPLDPESIRCQAQVSFAPMGSCKYQLNMVYVNQDGQFTRILEALNAFNAEVVDTNMVTLFGYTDAKFTVVVC